MLAAEWGTGQVFWSMLWFFMWVIWIWMLVAVFGDIFRSPDLSGWAKAAWSVFVLVLPYLGVFVYLVARGGKMQEHALRTARARDEAFGDYVRHTVSNGGSGTAGEISQLADLRDRGLINPDEYEQLKQRALA